jgi:phosphate transport system substrate-binding protein
MTPFRALCICLLTAGCGSSAPQGDPVRVDGSSTLYPLTRAVADEFMKANRRFTVDVKFSGTATGLERFCAGAADLVDASRPINTKEQDACRATNTEFIELPVAYDGVTVIVHPSNTWARAMTVAELKRLWEPAAEKKLTKWSQIRADWPDRDIHLFGPGGESGTFDYFTDAIVGEAGSSRRDYSASADDEQIVKSVASDEVSLGYVGFSYFDRNKQSLSPVAIDDLKDDVGRGPIEPSISNVGRGTYRPLSRPLFIYVNSERLQRAEVKSFVDFYLRLAGQVAERHGTIALSSRGYDLAQKRLAKAVTGTMYVAPESAHMGIEMLLEQE